MKPSCHITVRAILMLALMLILTIASSRIRADSGTCGGAKTALPFTDVATSPFFCLIAEAYFSGLTSGTSATTYSPSATVTREQMAAFGARAMDQSLKRGSRRAALNQWSTPDRLEGTVVGDGPKLVQSDGADLWVANFEDSTVSRVRGSDGKNLETWTDATKAFGVLVARGRIFVTGLMAPGRLYRIDPTRPAGAVTTLSSGLGDDPEGITTDGSFIWTANTGGSVSKVSFDGIVETFTSDFVTPEGILFDGANIWVTDYTAETLLKLNSDGTIAQTVKVGAAPRFPIFDGTNIWVPNYTSDSVTVVRASTGQVLATLTGNGLHSPYVAAFDGQRILVTNTAITSSMASLWTATDFAPVGFFKVFTFPAPFGACSDGINFWMTQHQSAFGGTHFPARLIRY